MPVESKILGVDLVPIKPISGVITLQEDITTDSCKSKIRKVHTLSLHLGLIELI